MLKKLSDIFFDKVLLLTIGFILACILLFVIHAVWNSIANRPHKMYMKALEAGDTKGAVIGRKEHSPLSKRTINPD